MRALKSNKYFLGIIYKCMETKTERTVEEFLQDIDNIFLANLNSLRKLSNMDLEDITFLESDMKLVKVALLSLVDGVCNTAAKGECEKLSFEMISTAKPPIC